MGLMNDIFSKTKHFFIKNKSGILIGIGVSGFISGTILAIGSTTTVYEKCKTELERKIDAGEEIIITNKGKERLLTKDIIRLSWKYYLPILIIDILSAGCILKAKAIDDSVIFALTTGLTSAERYIREYREKTAEKIGPKKEKDISDSVVADKAKDTLIREQDVIVTGMGTTLCQDYYTGRVFLHDIDKLHRAVDKINFRLRDEMDISLNEIYYEFDLPYVRVGDLLGFTIDNGYLELDPVSALSKNDLPMYVVKFKRDPTALKSHY